MTTGRLLPRALPILGLAALVATCRETTPTGPSSGRTGHLAVNPLLPATAELAAFGITADSLRVIVVRPVTDTLADETVFFDPDSTSVQLSLSLTLNASAESLDVSIELRGQGVALFSGTQRLEVVAGDNPTPPPLALAFIGPGNNVDTLKLSPPDSVITLGDSLRYRVTAVDALGNPVTQFFVSWSTSDTTVARANATGLVRAPNVRAGVVVRARAPNGRGDSTPVTFIPVPTGLQVLSGCGQSALPGALLPQPIVVRVVAGDGLGVKGIPVSFATSGGGSVGSPQVVTDASGDAQTSATLGPGAGSQLYSASAAGLTAVTCSQNALTLTATQLAFGVQPPATATAGVALAPGVTVELRDAQNQIVTTATNPVTIALGANPGGANLSGTFTVNAVNGVATFANLSLDKVAAGYTLVASSGALPPVTSTSFSVAAGAAAQLAFTTQPGNIIAGAAFSPSVSVEIRDAFGNPVTSATNTVVLGLGANPGGAVLLGNPSVSAAAGVATFPGVSLDKAATAYTITASAGGLSGATSASFDVAPGLAAQLAVTAHPASAIAGQAFTQPVVVEAQDQFGNLAPSFSGLVSVALGTNPSNGTLGGSTSATAAVGTASFAGLSIDNAGTGYTLVASAAGLANGMSGAIDVTAPTAGRFWIAAGGGAWSNPANWSGGIVPGANDTVFITLGGTYTVTLDVNDTVAFLTVGGGSGTQTLSASSRTFGVDSGATFGANAVLSATNSTLNGTGPLLNLGTAVLQNTTVNAPFANQGLARLRQSAVLNGGVVTTVGSTLRVEGDPFCCAASVTVNGGLNNTGLLEITAINGSGTTAALTVAGGPLVNASTGSIAVLPGTGGARTLTAAVDNLGTFTVDQPLTLNGASADHLNSGTLTVNQNLTLSQSGTTPSFTTNGTLVVAVGRTVAVSGGAFDVTGGVSGGLGTLDFNGVTVGLGVSLANDTLTVQFTNSTVNGPGTLGNTSGRTLFLQNTTVTAPLDNQGVVRARQSTAINGPFTTGTASTFRVEGDPFCCAAGVTVASGFTNNGVLELTAINGSGTTSALTVSGTIVNAATGTIASLPGTGGARTLTAAVDNQGTFTVDQPLTLNGASADHLNSGTLTVNQNLTLSQSGTTPSFTTSGTVVIATGRTLSVSGGAFDVTGGGFGGLGTLSVSGTTVGLGVSVANDTLTLSFTNSTVNGPGTLGNASGRTLFLQNTTVNAPLDNQGLVRARQSTAINGPFATGTASTFRVEGDPFCCAAGVTVANGFTNDGVLELTAINGSGTTSALTVSGTLVNAATGTIASLPGTGGARTLTAAVDNQGTFTVDQPLTLNGASADHLNSGTLTVNQNLTLNQSGTTPSFTTGGAIAIAASRTFSVSGGAFDVTGGSFGGLGTLSVNGTTVGLGVSVTNDTLTLSFTNSTVNGPGTLGNVAGRTLFLQNTTVNAPLDNQGLVRARQSTTINGAFTTGTASTFRVEGDPFCCAAGVTLANGFTNNGVLELTAINGSGTTSALTVSGTIVNAATGTIASLPGTGGARTLTAAVDNQGAFTVDQPLTVNGASATHLNGGTLTVNQALTLNQSGTTPSFTTSGTIVIATGQTFTVSAGAFDYLGGQLGGLGTLAFSNVTVGLGQSITNDTLTLSFVNGTVNGPGTLGNTSGRTLFVQNATVNAPMDNQGLLRARQNATFNGVVTTGTASIFRVEADPFCCTAVVAVTTGLTNNGTLELTAINGGGTTAQLTVSGGLLVNASTGTIASLPGTGGNRNLQAQLDNQGTVTVDQPLNLVLQGPSSNSGTLTASQDVTITQGSTFTSTGTVIVPTGHTLSFSGGAFDYAGGTLGGLGSVTFSTMVVNLGISLTTDTLALSFTNSTVQGTGTLGNASGRTLVLQNTTVTAPLDNQALVRARQNTAINGPFTTGTASTFRVEGDPFCCTANVTVGGGFTNNGLVELTAINGGGTTSQLTVSGGALVNAPSGTIHVLPGTGGVRTLTATLDNQGAVTVDQPLTLNGASATHLNSGSLSVNQNLTVSQSGTTPSFANDGIVEIGAGRTATFSGGTLTNNAAGTLRGTGTLNVSTTTFSNDGTINPGTSAGQLSITGSYASSATAVLNVELGGLVAGTEYDQLVVSDTATLGGILNVTLLPGFAPAVNDQFTIMTCGSCAGGFGQLILPAGMSANVAAGAVILTQVTVVGAGTVAWTAGGSGTWSNPANWSGGAVPSSADTVLIDAVGTYTVTLDVNATVGRLVLGGGSGAQTLSGSGRTLTLGDGGTVATSGVLTLTGNSTIAGAGTLTNNGTFTFDGDASLAVANQGSLLLPGGATANFNAALTQTGSIVVNGNNGPSALTTGGSWTNQGTIQLTGTSWGGAITVAGGAGVLTNATGATIEILNGVGNSVAGGLDNQGTLQVSGPLTVTLGGQAFSSPSGAVDVTTGSTLTLNGGSVQIGSGTTQTGSGTINLTGAATLDLASDVTLAVTGPQWLLGGTVTVNGPGALINQGTLLLTSDVVNAAVDNQGTLELPGGSTSQLNGALTQTGTLRVNGNNGPAALTVAAGFSNQGTLELTGTSWGGSLTLSTGTLTNAPGATFQVVNGVGSGYTGVFDNQGTVSVGGPLTFFNTGQTLLGTAGTFDVAAGRTLTVNGGTLAIGTGTVLSGTGTLSLSGTTTLSLASDVTFASAGPSWSFPGTVTVNGPGALINQGTLLLTSDVVNAAVDNQGTLEVPGGSTSQLNGALTQIGTLRLNGNNGPAALTVASGFTNQGTLELTGTSWGGNLAVTTGTLTNAGPAGLVTTNGIGNSYTGAFDNQGTVSVGGPLTFFNTGQTLLGTTGTFDVAPSQTLTVNGGALAIGTGTVLSGTGTLSLSGTTTLSLASNVTFASAGPNWSFPGTVTVNGPGALINQGTLLLTSDVINAAVDNQGTLEVPGGSTSQLNGALTQSGTLRLNGNNGPADLTVAAGFSNLGTLELTGTSWGGSLTLSTGTLTNALGATFQVVNGVGSGYTGAFDNQGTVSVGGPLTFFNTGQTLLGTTGTFDVAPSRTLTVNGGTLAIGTGTVLSGTGTLSLSGTTTLSLASDVTFASAGPSWSFPGTVTVNGPGALINQATLLLTSDVVNAAVDNQGTLELPGGSTSQLNGALTQSGTLRLNGNNGPADLTVASGFTNQGTLELTGTSWGGTLVVSSGTLTNAAILQTVNGVGNSYTGASDNQGTLLVGGPLTLGAGAHQNAGVVEIAATRTLTVATGGSFTNLATGTLRGNGTLNVIAATFSNAGGINPGTSAGTLTVTGALPLAATSVLNIELGGTGAGQFDQIAVSGAVTQNGTLNVTLVGGFTPALNDLFTVVTTGAGLAGAFTQTILPPGMTATVVGNDLVLNQATSAVGTTITWAGATSGSWSSAANWNPALVPTGTDTVVIDAPGTYTVTLDVDAAVAKLLLGTPLGGTQTLAGAGRLLTLGAGSTINPGGALTLTGGSTLDGVSVLTNQGTLTLTGSTANLTIDNQGLLSVSGAALNGQVSTGGSDTVRVGAGGAGTVTFAKGFTVNGRLQYRIPTGTNVVAVTQGALTIAPAGRLDVVAAGGTAGTITAALDNQGTINLTAATTTLNGASATHSNTGTINVTGGNLLVAQSGTAPSFTNGGAIVVPAGRTFSLTGGGYTQTATGSLSGAGTANFTTLVSADFATAIGVARTTIDGTPTTLNASQSLGGRWSITNATLSGPATWTVGPTDTLDLTGGTYGIGLTNQGLLRAVGVAGFNGPFANTAASITQLGLLPGSSTGGGTMTFATGFTNTGTLRLQSQGGSTLTVTVTTGTLVNATGALFLVDPAGVGIRRLTALVDNQGTLAVNQSLTVNAASAAHTSAGTIDIATGQTLLAGNGSSLALSGSGKAQGAGTLDVAGAFTAPAGTAVTVGTVRVGGVLTVGGSFGAGTTVFTGTAQSIPVLSYGNVTVSGTASFAGTTAISGALAVSGTGSGLTLGGAQVTVGGDFSTAASGILNMTNANGVLTVDGNASFGGGGTSTVLTAGRMFVRGNLTQPTGSATSAFSTSGTHRVVLDGTGVQTVTFTNPGTAAASSHFQNLEILNTVGSVTLASNVFVNGTFQSTPGTGTPKVVGGGFGMTAAGLNVNALTLDRVLFHFTTTSTALPAFDNVGFVNYQPNDLQFDIAHPGNAAALVFTNLNFTPVATGTGTGYYLRVDDSDDLSPIVQVQVSHFPIDLANAVARTLQVGSLLPQITWLP